MILAALAGAALVVVAYLAAAVAVDVARQHRFDRLPTRRTPLELDAPTVRYPPRPRPRPYDWQAE